MVAPTIKNAAPAPPPASSANPLFQLATAVDMITPRDTPISTQGQESLSPTVSSTAELKAAQKGKGKMKSKPKAKPKAKSTNKEKKDTKASVASEEKETPNDGSMNHLTEADKAEYVTYTTANTGTLYRSHFHSIASQCSKGVTWENVKQYHLAMKPKKARTTKVKRKAPTEKKKQKPAKKAKTSAPAPQRKAPFTVIANFTSETHSFGDIHHF